MNKRINPKTFLPMSKIDSFLLSRLTVVLIFSVIAVQANYAQATQKIWGVVHDESYQGLEDVKIYTLGLGMYLSGAGGMYCIEVPHGWSGWVRPDPSHPDYRFEPYDRTFNNVTTDLHGNDFMGLRKYLNICGRVRMPWGTGGYIGVGGVSIMFHDVLGSVERADTDGNGYYCKKVRRHWSGTAKPFPQWWVPTFTPESRSYTNVTRDYDDQYYNTKRYYGVAGLVKTSDDLPIPGVILEAIALGGGFIARAKTDHIGWYRLVVGYRTRFKVRCNKTGYKFSPYLPIVGPVESNQRLDFTCTQLPDLLKISGYVRTDDGTAISSVEMIFSDGESVTTNWQGHYKKNVPVWWSGTVTPTWRDYAFTPQSRSYSDVYFEYEDQDYTGKQKQIYVNTAATGNNDGSSWADAFNYLQDALAAASSGNEIWVAEGIYKPDCNSTNPSGTGDRTATFRLINSVAIYGGFPSDGGAWEDRDLNLYETILSGDLNGDDIEVAEPCDLLNEPTRAENSYQVVFAGASADETTILDGFTITAGNANGSGGGMCNVHSSPTLTNCTFSGNTAEYGGGMANGGISRPSLTNCAFIGNSAETGGGMHNSQSDPTVINCTFSGNTAKYGGGINNFYSNLTVTNCTFIGNTAEYGGGVHNGNSNSTLTNCTFSGNSASDTGGGMCNVHSMGSYTTKLANCIFWGNSSPTGPQIYNILVENLDPAIVTYSDVQGGYPGTGNIDADPMFHDTDGPDDTLGTEDDNLRLLPDSPCIDAGDNAAVPADTADLDGDGDTSEPIPFDLDGNRRIVDGDRDGISTVDMGAYESQVSIIGAIMRFFLRVLRVLIFLIFPIAF